MAKKPTAPKLSHPLERAKACLSSGRYVVTYHAKERQLQRIVPLPDVILAIENGHHEKGKDKYDPGYKSWNYSIRGKDSNKRHLRIVISFDQEDLLIITVIVLKGKRDEK